jgi:hypothetical protein
MFLHYFIVHITWTFASVALKTTLQKNCSAEFSFMLLYWAVGYDTV